MFVVKTPAHWVFLLFQSSFLSLCDAPYDTDIMIWSDIFHTTKKAKQKKQRFDITNKGQDIRFTGLLVVQQKYEYCWKQSTPFPRQNQNT